MLSNISFLISFILILMPSVSLSERREHIQKELSPEIYEVLEADTKLKIAAYSSRMEDPLYPSDLTTVKLKQDEYSNNSQTGNCSSDSKEVTDKKNYQIKN